MTHRIEILGRVGLGVVMLSTGCARSVNLLNPDTPRFVGEYATPVVATQTPGGATLRVVTFNIKASREIDRSITLLESDSLRGADVVALQEMNAEGVDRIARALRLNYVYYPSLIHPVNEDYFGPAILSRWPIERSWKVFLPHEAWGRKLRRTATAAVVQANGRRVLVYSVHLETMVKLSEPKRSEQARAVTEDAKGFSGPVVIAGDLNDYAMAARIRQQGYLWTSEWLGPTHLVFTLDHILTRGLVPARPGSVGVVDQVRGASDHRPVWAVLAFAPASLSACMTGAEREISREVAVRGFPGLSQIELGISAHALTAQIQPDNSCTGAAPFGR